MSYLPEPDPATGLLPPGRYSVELETLRDVCVSTPILSVCQTKCRFGR